MDTHKYAKEYHVCRETSSHVRAAGKCNNAHKCDDAKIHTQRNKLQGNFNTTRIMLAVSHNVKRKIWPVIVSSFHSYLQQQHTIVRCSCTQYMNLLSFARNVACATVTKPPPANSYKHNNNITNKFAEESKLHVLTN